MYKHVKLENNQPFFRNRRKEPCSSKLVDLAAFSTLWACAEDGFEVAIVKVLDAIEAIEVIEVIEVVAEVVTKVVGMCGCDL
jgi:hypothetical protein